MSAQIPTAIQGVCGILTVHVVDQEIPFLLPVAFCKKLGMNLSMPKMQIFWEYINRHSDVQEAGDGGHLAIEIFQFPKSGWQNPHSNPRTIVGNGSQLDSNIPRSDFELCNSTFGSRASKLSLGLLQESSEANARGSGMPSS